MKIIKWLGMSALAAMLAFAAAPSFAAVTPASIKAAGVLVVGVKADYPPFGFLNPKGEIEGFGPDLVRDIAQSLGVKVKLVPVTAANRIQYLDQGRIDVILATLTYTDDRAKVIDMVKPFYYGAGINVLTEKKNHLKSWGDLKGKEVCLVQATFANRQLQTEYGVQGKAFPDLPGALTALRQNDCVAVAYDNTALAGVLRQPQWSGYEIPLNTIDFQPWAIGLKKGSTEMDDYLSKRVISWFKNGTISQLEAKWKIRPAQFVKDQEAKYK